MRNEAYSGREFNRWGRVFPLLFLNATLAFADPAVLLETTRLVPADGAPNGGYGRSVAIDGNIAVVGATAGDPGSGPELQGAAYVFERNSQGVWQQTAKLTRGPDQAGVSGNPAAFFLRAYRRGQCHSRSHHWSEPCSGSNGDGKVQMDGVRHWPDSRRAD